MLLVYIASSSARRPNHTQEESDKTVVFESALALTAALAVVLCWPQSARQNGNSC